jgi:mono/diheme cytochrome c family protein
MQMRRTRKRVILAVALLAASGAHAHDIANGRAIAQVWCGNCHLVDPRDQRPARDATPTFPSIAQKKSTTAASLSAFLKARHGDMPDLSLNRDEIADVSAYILSLRK